MTAKHFWLWAAGLSLSIAGPAVFATEVGQEITSQVTSASYRHYLDDLLYTHDGNNRDAMTGPDLVPARDNIFATFQSFGLPTELYAFTHSGVHYNVMATQLGTRFPASYYIVGAHFDSAGCPGADDDASGIAAVLEIAHILSQYPSEYTIKYMAFDMEEYGLYGSAAYANTHMADDIRGMIALDMVAWDAGGRTCDIWGRATSAPIKGLLAQAVAMYGQGLATTIKGQRDQSDHASFEAVGFQACHLRESLGNTNYHLQIDSVDVPGYINYIYAADMTRCIVGYLVDNARVHLPDDCNDNNIPDPQEIVSDPSLDCDGNGVIDACELNGVNDCNGNGRLDACDIAGGLSNDADGNGVPDECDDVTPPSPSPMTFERDIGLPHPISTTEITMTASEAADPFGVQYYFYATGVASHSRDWGADRVYTDTGLQVNRNYSYKVKARDLSVHRNETQYSAAVSIATFIETPTALTFGALTNSSIQITTPSTFTRLSSNLSGLFFEVTRLDGTPVGGSQANAWVKTQTITAGGLTPGQTYRFRVKARNYFGVNETPWFPVSGYKLQSIPAKAGPFLLTDPDVSGQELPSPP